VSILLLFIAAVVATFVGYTIGVAVAPDVGAQEVAVESDGTVVDGQYGDASDIDLAAPITAMTPTPSGEGYILTGADGGVFTYGDAAFYGSIPGTYPFLVLDGGIVDVAADPVGTGYWLLGADGGVFSFGAPFHQNVIEWLPPYTRAETINAEGTGYTITDNADNVWHCPGGGMVCGITNPPIKQYRPTLCGQGPGDRSIGWDDVEFILAVQASVRAEWHCWLVDVVQCESQWNRFAENPRSTASGYGQFLRGWWGDRYPGDWTDPWWQARAIQYLLDNGGPSHWQCKAAKR
jgi:hypothetical protein